MHFGDLVIQFPNPDHPKNKKLSEDTFIKFDQKDKIFKKSFFVIDVGNLIENLEFEIL